MKFFGKILRRWLKADEGVTAIEFSLLATPFVIFTIGIIEVSIMFMANTLLNGAVYDAARMIRTGQVQQATTETPLAMFQNALCGTASVLLDCNNFQYQVQTITDFSDADITKPPLDKNGNLLTQPFNPGGSSSVVMIRVIYLYPLMTPLIGALMSDYPGNKKMLMATTVIETEPYEFNPGS